MNRLARAHLLLVPALALMTAACSRPRPVIEARPALWRVADADTTIWLLGSIHALPPGVHWQTPAVERAISDADTLILEVAPADPEAARTEFLAVAKRDGLPPILDRVPRDRRAALARGIDAADVSAWELDKLTTWAAALTIGARAAHREEASGADGVEAILTRRFAGKGLGALETRGGQLATFDRLPEGSQRNLLVQAAQDARDPAGGYKRLFAAWAAGNEAGLAATLDPVRRDAAIERTLVRDRNARWASDIVRRLERPGHVLIAVGAGHLVGAGSVVAMLRARGLKVERME